MALSGKKARTKYAENGVDKTQERQARSLDALAEFDKFTHVIMPRLRKMVLENWSPDRIRKEFAPMMQAMMVKKAVEGNFAAIKDTLDRYEGTAVQRVEQKTTYQQMDKKELAALALQRLRDSGLIEVQSRVIESKDENEES